LFQKANKKSKLALGRRLVQNCLPKCEMRLPKKWEERLKKLEKRT
jgi:hypothetical protein